MNQVLLETIIEKLESLELSLLKENKTGNDEAVQKDLLKEIKIWESEITKLPSHLKIINEKINELSKNITFLNFKLEKGVNENINHKHHLHKGVWIAIGFFITSLLFLFCWINCHYEKKIYEANDIKYRYLKLNGNAVLLRLLYHTDSLYNLNNDLFTTRVNDREESLSHQAELLWLAGEKKRERKKIKNRIERTIPDK